MRKTVTSLQLSLPISPDQEATIPIEKQEFLSPWLLDRCIAVAAAGKDDSEALIAARLAHKLDEKGLKLSLRQESEA